MKSIQSVLPLKEIGIAILLLVTPIGMYMNHFVVDIRWSDKLAVVGCLLAVNYESLFKRTKSLFKSGGWLLDLILLFQLICLVSALLLGLPISNNIFWGQITVCFFIIALKSNLERNKISYDSLLVVMQFLTTILAFLSLYCLRSGLFEETRSEEVRILEAFTMSAGCVANVIVSLFSLTRLRVKFPVKLIVLAGVIVSFFCALSLTKRTPVVVMLIAVALFAYKYYPYLKRYMSTFVFYSAAAALFVYFIVGTDVFIELFDNFVTNTTNGVNDILTGSRTDNTGSAVARFINRERAWDFFYSNYSIPNLIFGAGYLSLGQIDNQLLQAYLEMGLFGALAVILSVVLPFYYILKSKADLYSWQSFVIQFSAMLCLYQSICFYNSGHPYSFVRWIPMSFFAFCLESVRREINVYNTHKNSDLSFRK